MAPRKEQKLFTPEEQRREEELKKRLTKAASLGMRNKDIAAVEGIPNSTLTRKYAAELAEGRAHGKMTIMKTAFQMAESGKFPTMTIFFLKTKCGWREKDRPKFGDENQQKSLTQQVWPDKLPVDPIEASKVYQKIMRGDQNGTNS